MKELAATVVDLLVGHLRARAGAASGPSPSAGGAADVYDLVRGRLAGETSLEALETEARSDEPSEQTRQWLQLALQHTLARDPGFARQAEELVGRVTTQEPAVSGTSSAVQRQDARLHHARAGRDINQKLVSRSSNIKVALGGGVVLSGVLLFIWNQYTTESGRSAERESFQREVVAVCDRIRTTGNAQLNPDLEGGFSFDQSDLEQVLRSNQRVVDEQLADLLDRATPEDLSDEREAVADAGRAVAAANVQALARTREMAPVFGLSQLQALFGEPEVRALYEERRRLGDRLTRLAGSTCTIEQPQQSQ
jgi:hypothetical protein